MNKKLSKLVSVLVLMFPLLASFATTTVQAAEGETVTVNLHKRVFEDGKTPSVVGNTGEKMDFGGKALNDVAFEVYDVSADYISLLETKTADEANKEIVDNSEKYQKGKPIQSGKTAGEGLVTFSNLPIKSQKGKYATYLFVETNSPVNIKSKATPIVLTMPIYKGESNDINKDIHVYPKNEEAKLITKKFDQATEEKLSVKIDGKHKYYNVEKGQEFGYEIKALLPWNISDKDFYHITDTPNKGMKVNVGTVEIDGLNKGTDFVVEAKGDGYVLKFDTKSQAIKDLAGKHVAVTYQAYLTDDVAIDTGINNEASVTVGNNTNPSQPGTPGEPEKPTDPETPTTGPEVFTGGKKFQKVDDKSGKSLEGAKFNLVKVDKAGEILEYATLTDGKYTWNKAKDTATSFDSDAKGKLEVTGLEYSEKLKDGASYALVEYEAPTGYALLENPVKFNVVKDQFDTEILPVTNIKKGLLPSTGGNGIYMFLAAGSLLMIGALVWYRRTQVEAEV